MKKTITSEHLDAAVAACAEGNWSSDRCLLAQAFGGPEVVFGSAYSSITLKEPDIVAWITSDSILELAPRMNKFDQAMGDGGPHRVVGPEVRADLIEQIRASLPLEILYEERPRS